MSTMSTKKQMYDIAVIGGGAAGMFSAGIAAGFSARVVLIEQNPFLGKKLNITGKGRCNLTNRCSAEEVLRNVPQNGKFLYSAINQLPPFLRTPAVPPRQTGATGFFRFQTGPGM